MSFERNDRYFGGPKGTAKIPKLKIRIIKETIPQMEALISGEVDLMRSGTVNPEQAPFFETDRSSENHQHPYPAGLFSGDGCPRPKRPNPV